MIALFKAYVTPSVAHPLMETLQSGFIGEGEVVKEFERKLQSWVGSSRVLTLNSCTSAITLALRLSGVTFGSEVVVTPMTCKATVDPIMSLGAIPVWADIDPWTGNIDLEDARKKTTTDTKAILGVDWAGYPCDLPGPWQRSDSDHEIRSIRDAAHYFGRTIPSADYTCYSFQAIKHLTTVDGGALVCDRKADHVRARLMRWYGLDREGSSEMRCRQNAEFWGHKFHMNDVNAVIGIGNLAGVEQRLAAHKRNAYILNREFEENRFVKPLRYEAPGKCSYWIYTVRVDDPAKFEKFMKARGVAASQVHDRVDKHRCYEGWSEPQTLPGVTEFMRHQISIPCGWWLSEDDLNRIIGAVRDYERELRPSISADKGEQHGTAA